MRGSSSVFSKTLRLGCALALVLLTGTGCSISKPAEPTRTVQIQQSWELQPGNTVGGHRIVGGLGDISIELKGDNVYAPFAGRVQPNVEGCVIFSTPDVPAYLFRLCGLRQPRLGAVQQGEAIGSGDVLQFAALRKQPDGKWAMVEPARDFLEQTLQP
ncbi:hypothetical protein IQ268_15010 [Oculatella sp. LEGE 06141]|uniref:hypothetical protein n=1 Tax=Oculatella sp. LEGE 06141 TaxID=1828648 RepID=UPI0018808875|nr:hypothetical protein [Oculatella sp. LEGE 06141]MBE9179879.1 hypothetical protein [Oculatella sp. LEGE 06141]